MISPQRELKEKQLHTRRRRYEPVWGQHEHVRCIGLSATHSNTAMLLDAHQVEEEKPSKFKSTLIPVHMCCRQTI